MKKDLVSEKEKQEERKWYSERKRNRVKQKMIEQVNEEEVAVWGLVRGEYKNKGEFEVRQKEDILIFRMLRREKHARKWASNEKVGQQLTICVRCVGEEVLTGESKT